MGRTEKLLDREIMAAWSQAAADLQIRVDIPFTLVADEGEAEIYEGHVVDFGGPRGTVFGAIKNEHRKETDTIQDPRRNAGYYSADLSNSYCRYNRQLFIDTLNDWKWFGKEVEQPPWYTGKNWS
jgi:hypothetical protein